MTRLIVFTGKAGVGKSTAASYLARHHGFEVVKFAGPLKNMLRAIGLTDSEIEGDSKERPCDLLCGKTPRHAMQTLGTEWGRDLIGPDFWAGIWEAKVRQLLRKGVNVVADDCRFPNEMEAAQRLGGAHVRIHAERNTTLSHNTVSPHISENSLPFSPNDRIVINSVSGLEKFHNDLNSIIADITQPA